jgi:4-hydroxybenzoate polyprenyltransferase
MAVGKQLQITLEMIKIEHTLFALPFALLGAVMAAEGVPSWEKVFWISLCMVGARSAAMAFNRLVDRQYDAANPRTSNRALPAGLLSTKFVIGFTIVASLLFLVAAANLNQLTLWLSPVALGSVLAYSYMKRFTAFSHLVLGWCLAIAPTGAWLAIRGQFALIPILLSLIVMLWTAGFDIVYACQDCDFDRQANLHSIPQRWGIRNALWIARSLHLIMLMVLIIFFFTAKLGWLGAIGVLLATALLVRQHRLVHAEDLSRLDMAFFTTNAMLSLVLFFTVGVDVIWRRY